MTSSKQQRRVHPAVFIAVFFAVLIVLESAFLVVASVQPDDRIPPFTSDTAQREQR